MSGILKRGAAAALVIGLASVAAAQTPQRDARAAAPPQPGGTAAIAGVVVTADSAPVPIRMAHVVLIGAMTGTLRVTSTDRDGRFQFVNLPADRYQVGASKLPYLGAVAGARRPARPGTPVVVTEGQKLAGVTIRLPRGAVITGVITDEMGRPAPNVQVGLQQRKLQNGERVLVRVPGETMSDERGQYRIHGIAPGEYVVTAIPFRGGAGARVLTNAEVDAVLRGATPQQPPAQVPAPAASYAPVFFPGTTRAADAAPVVVAAGEERQNVDIRLELATTATVEGLVVTSEGQPPGNGTVFLQGGQTGQSTFSRVGPDGRFRFPLVTPGTWTVMANASTPGASGPQAGQVAMATVEVAGADVIGLQLTLRPPLSFAAQIAFEGTSTPPTLAGHRIPLKNMSADSTGMLGMMTQSPATNGAGVITFAGVLPGRYLITPPLSFGASTASLNWGLQSVVVDGKDVTDLPIEIAGTAPKQVVVTFSDRWQEVSGRLADASGAPVSDYVILVFPVDKQYWLPGTRRIVAARPGTDGGFKVGGAGPVSLPVGEYFVAAVTDLGKDEQYDPVLLESLIPAAVRTTIGPGERKTQNLNLR